MSTMKLNHELTFICCILTIVATEIQCSLRWEGVHFNSTTYMRFPKESKLTLGSGSKPNYFPIIEYRADYDPYPVLKCTAYIHSRDRCNFTLHVRKGIAHVAIMKAYQFSDTKLAVAWLERAYNMSPKFFVKVTTIDLITCSTMDIFNTSAMGIVEFYPDSFELIALTDTYGGYLSRTSFDVDGRQIGKSTSSVSKDVIDIFPASTKSPSKGLFISTFDYRNNTLSFAYTNGKEIKRLVDVGNQPSPSNAISYANDTSRTICWVNRSDVNATKLCECAQFDETGKQLWGHGTRCDGERPFDVRNLKGGGVVLLSYTNDEIHITEMRPRQEALKSSVKVRDGPVHWDEDSVKVMDFNEADRTFSMYWVVAPRRTLTYTDVAYDKFSFPSKASR